METKDILTFAVEMGMTMLENGAEIYRIEETITRILKFYNVEHINVYVLSNGIFASANEDMDDSCSIVRHIPKNSVNLFRISALNQLSREICSGQLEFEEGWKKLKEIRKEEIYPVWVLILACGIGCGCFGYLFGGSIFDGIVSAFLGALEEFLLLAMAKARFSRSIAQIFCSFIITMLSFVPTLTNISFHQDKMIIGAIMVLVPGIMFTTAIRDIYNGDYLSGAIHLLDALLTALCIAAGVVIAFYVVRLIQGGAFI